jgi:hypothetical protein
MFPLEPREISMNSLPSCHLEHIWFGDDSYLTVFTHSPSYSRIESKYALSLVLPLMDSDEACILHPTK